MAKLTIKQQRFVEEYLIDLNATQAAIRAGYSVNNADKIGSELLGKTRVSEEISKAMAERSKRTGVNQDNIVIELTAIGFSNATDYVQIVEEPIIVNGHYVKDPDTGQLRKETVVKIIPTDKLPEDKKKAIAGIKEGRYGIELITCDKVKALELLGRHLGMFKDKVEITGLNEEKGKLDGILKQLRN
ncbi:MAG: terminase small subunit [Anaerocolumna sp.]|jgi:phage terminase small subunit|nr:terminase small subunit [Anaerocolumna sp.]